MEPSIIHNGTFGESRETYIVEVEAVCTLASSLFATDLALAPNWRVVAELA